MAESIRGKVAFITGASSGIGRALALAAAGMGARVALVGRDAARLQAVADRIGAAHPGTDALATDALAIAADMTRPDEVARAVAAAQDRLGTIDILLANAGLYIPGEVAAGDPDAWDYMLGINVNSVFRTVHAVLPGMIAQASGQIVVTSSISGHQALHWEPVYSASKHAIQSFVHGLRRQVAAHNIKVGEVAPGVVLNELWGYSDPDAIDSKVAAREGLRSEDVAEAVMFMLTRPANVTIRDLVILPQNQDI